MSKLGEGKMARRGVSSCAIAFISLALLPRYVQTQPSFAFKLLQIAAVCMAFTSATVVNSLTAFASLQCDEGHFDEVTGKVVEEHPQLAKGTALGKFRSAGQLGRALGPLLGEFNQDFLINEIYKISMILSSLRLILDFWSINYIQCLCHCYDHSFLKYEVDSCHEILMISGIKNFIYIVFVFTGEEKR